jgi:hypothetical protein
MQDVPSVGSARGVFDIFVPGAFLLLHLLALLTLCYPSQTVVNTAREAGKTGAVLAITVFVCFGYLIGVLLRLIKTEAADKLSGQLCAALPVAKRHDEPAEQLKARREQWRRQLREPFPYFSYLEDVSAHKLPSDVKVFYDAHWKPRRDAAGNRQFFNHCKVIVNAVDKRSGAEAAAAEALTRYVSGMFYALSCCLVILVAAAAMMSSAVPLLLAGTYVVALLIILRTLRLLRFKEAEAILTATYHNYCKGTIFVPCRLGVEQADALGGRRGGDHK